MVAPLASLIAVFTTSLAATTGLVHMLVNRFAADRVSIADLAKSEAALLILAATVVVTLVVGSLLLMIWPGGEREKTSLPRTETTNHPPGSRQILRLTRNAERLDSVEQDLIRAICDGKPYNDYTRNLLAEMRICTRKLLGELSDIDRLRDDRRTDEKKAETVNN